MTPGLSEPATFGFNKRVVPSRSLKVHRVAGVRQIHSHYHAPAMASILPARSDSKRRRCGQVDASWLPRCEGYVDPFAARDPRNQSRFNVVGFIAMAISFYGRQRVGGANNCCAQASSPSPRLVRRESPPDRMWFAESSKFSPPIAALSRSTTHHHAGWPLGTGARIGA
jgi:hypothetical protein